MVHNDSCLAVSIKVLFFAGYRSCCDGCLRSNTPGQPQHHDKHCHLQNCFPSDQSASMKKAMKVMKNAMKAKAAASVPAMKAMK